jgi:tetratricopeptide (TPR) repeat protein
VAAPPEPAPEQVRADRFARAGYHLALGDAARAEAEIDAVLGDDPDDRKGLLWKGDLLEQAGRREEALAAYERGIAAYWAANPGAEEPPAALVARRDALLAAPAGEH